MAVVRVAELLRVNPHRIWTIFNHWVKEGRKLDDPSTITKLGVDETSSRKGHNYVAVAVDLDENRVIHTTEGKGKESLNCFKQYPANQEVKPDQISGISSDLSPSFIAGSAESISI